MTTTNETQLFLQLSVEEINLILAALQELPAKACNPLTQKIHEQARPQLDPEVTEVPAEATAEATAE
jgi:hypothetical protein